jgi:hypothetical protein
MTSEISLKLFMLKCFLPGIESLLTDEAFRVVLDGKLRLNFNILVLVIAPLATKYKNAVISHKAFFLRLFWGDQDSISTQ